jgi:hypothetical protein
VLTVKDLNTPTPKLQPQTAEKFFPVPKGDTYYSQAKRAEYIDKDLGRAETLY